MRPVVELLGIRVAHDGQAVLDVPGLSVSPGEILGVIGPNGAGKSTLLRILGLLETPTVGGVRFLGEPVTPAQGLWVRRRMASVFQDPLLADATVFDNVALGLRFRGVPRAEVEPRVALWLERFGIAALGARRARTLSGGEAQRAALARALVVEPELLLLDEPLSSLDQPTRETLIADLGGILRGERITTVLVTHDRGEALALADRVAVLIGGRCLQVGATAEVFRAPVSEEVARFVGVETIVDCQVVGRRGALALLEAGQQSVEVVADAMPGEWVRMCLRPEDVTVKVGEPPAVISGVRNRLAGRIKRLDPGGQQVRAIVDCGFPVVALVTHRTLEELHLAEGVAVTAQFKPTAPHLLRPARAPGAREP